MDLARTRQSAVSRDTDCPQERGTRVRSPLPCSMALRSPSRPDDRVGLIGRNGTGKSSLLGALLGKIPLDAGEVQRRPGLSIASVEQEPVLPPAETLRESLVLRGDFANMHDDRALWAREARLNEFLQRFSVNPDASPASVSGGERKRAALALAFAMTPDLMLLDEPTNHLDVDGIETLEDLLQRNITCIVITHDRRFLDKVATSIAELDRGILRTFPGQLLGVRGAEGGDRHRRGSRAPALREVLGAGGSVDPQGCRGATHAQRRPRETSGASARGKSRQARAHRSDQTHGGYRRALGQARGRARECRQEVRRPTDSR